MCKRKTLILFCTGLLMTSLTTYASERPRGGISFESLDADGDSQISLQEFVENVPFKRRSPEEIFGRLDTNEDGTISPQEFDARPTGKGRRR